MLKFKTYEEAETFYKDIQKLEIEQVLKSRVVSKFNQETEPTSNLNEVSSKLFDDMRIFVQKNNRNFLMCQFRNKDFFKCFKNEVLEGKKLNDEFRMKQFDEEQSKHKLSEDVIREQKQKNTVEDEIPSYNKKSNKKPVKLNFR